MKKFSSNTRKFIEEDHLRGGARGSRENVDAVDSSSDAAAKEDDKRPLGSPAAGAPAVVKASVDSPRPQRALPVRRQPPMDGGTRAWVVLVASFLTNGIVFGVMNSYSVIYAVLQAKLEAEGVGDASSKASLVGSLTIGCTFALSPVAGVLTDRFGIRPTAVFGGCLAAIGMMASSFLSHSVEALYLTYGVLFGVGSSLAYTPSLGVLPLHFNRRLGLANGIVTAGSSVFTIVLPPVLDQLIVKTDVETTLRALAGLAALIPICAMCFRHPPKIPVDAGHTRNGVVSAESSPMHPSVNEAEVMHELKIEKSKRILGINFDIWKRKKYVIWAIAIPSALFGYFVPYVHMVKFVDINFPESDGKILVMCIGVTSGVGRLVFGKIADMPKVNRIMLQQISFLSIGVMTMLIVATNSFNILIAIALVMGLFDGCFISILGPIAFDLCGAAGATQAIGFLLGLCSIPLTAGPPIAGAIFDHTGSYTVPFLLAGIPPIIGAMVLLLIRFVKSPETDTPLPNGNINSLDVEGKGGDLKSDEKADGIGCANNRKPDNIGSPQDDVELQQLTSPANVNP
ncbi:monocarboxylate transporter 10 isoform X2 [Ischnura elegans]|uniref:monocarboxylate transporter 10 isoform X2 n=1 Tax=Ischnura elegans TaxID=197161 RepID=UPI001ED8AE76|nr:monocarboxylate transporter 10 isoform X2 [Ischnura elegans]